MNADSLSLIAYLNSYLHVAHYLQNTPQLCIRYAVMEDGWMDGKTKHKCVNKVNHRFSKLLAMIIQGSHSAVFHSTLYGGLTLWYVLHRSQFLVVLINDGFGLFLCFCSPILLLNTESAKENNMVTQTAATSDNKRRITVVTILKHHCNCLATNTGWSRHRSGVRGEQAVAGSTLKKGICCYGHEETFRMGQI